KPGADPSSGISSVDVLIPTERHPACRQREARSGSCTERENLAGDAKGKSTSGSNREAESTDAPERGGLPRSSDEVGECPRSEELLELLWVLEATLAMEPELSAALDIVIGEPCFTGSELPQATEDERKLPKAMDEEGGLFAMMDADEADKEEEVEDV